MPHNDIYEIREMAYKDLKTLIGCSAVIAVMIGVTAVFIGVAAIPTVLLLAAFMVIGVEFANRQTHRDRKFIKRMVLIAVLLCALWAVLTVLTYPVAAISIDAAQDGSQIQWTITDGVPPYQVWTDTGKLYDTYPASGILTNVDPGRSYTLTVTDANNDTATHTATSLFYTYPLEIWALFGLFLIFMVASYFVPYAAFGAALIGGFLMLMIGPNSDYAGYLRLIGCAAFIAGLGAIFVGGGHQ